MKKDKRKAFKTCDNKGFHITFPNGVTLSTQFGWANYCENYDDNYGKGNFEKVFEDQRDKGRSSNDAEIAIFTEDGDWITAEWSKNDDTVQGRVTIDQWLSALDFCRNWKPKSPSETDGMK
jgi:hypothetical protein